MARFLVKATVTLEPGDLKDNYHESLRNLCRHNRSNLIRTIGVDPVIYRAEIPDGRVDLQLWITTVFEGFFHNHVVPFYFLGARKYLFMCHSKNSAAFVSEVIELVNDRLNVLNEFIILLPGGLPEEERIRNKVSFERLFEDKLIENYSFFEWEQESDLEELFQNIAQDLIANLPSTGYVPLGFNLGAMEALVRNQGFEINDAHEVEIVKEDILFIVDLERNTIRAQMADCSDCEEACKLSKNLCVVVENEGFATIEGLGDLRLLSVLFAIEDGTIFALRGEKRSEDLSVQLDSLRKEAKKLCKKKKFK